MSAVVVNFDVSTVGANVVLFVDVCVGKKVEALIFCSLVVGFCTLVVIFSRDKVDELVKISVSKCVDVAAAEVISIWPLVSTAEELVSVFSDVVLDGLAVVIPTKDNTCKKNF